MGRILGIVVVAGLLIFGAWKIIASSVDRTNPNEVGTAFLKFLKMEEIDKAKDFYLPAEADAWETETNDKLSIMRTNAMAGFKAAIPDEPKFVDVPAPKGSTDKTVKAGDTTLSMRQVEGDWYITHSSQP